MKLTSEQRAVARRIAQIAKRVGASPKEVKSAYQTGLVESGLRNLPGGDADSQGWRQERASLYPDPRNLDASIERYFRETSAVKGKYGRAGDLAAAVQRPAAQYRGRYEQRSADAEALMRQFAGVGRPSEDGQRTRTRTVTTSPGVDNSQARAQLLTRFLQSKSANPVDMALQFRQLQDVAPTTKKVTETVGGHDGHDHEPGGPRKGTYTVAPTANRAGVPMTRDIRRFLADMTRSGRSVNVGTGSNHSRMTASGNVSDHWDGNAADIPATGKTGDLIAAHAIRAATGMPYQQALAKARQGGIQNFQTPKGRVQIIWRAPGHFDHVHVGVRR